MFQADLFLQSSIYSQIAQFVCANHLSAMLFILSRPLENITPIQLCLRLRLAFQKELNGLDLTKTLCPQIQFSFRDQIIDEKIKNIKSPYVRIFYCPNTFLENSAEPKDTASMESFSWLKQVCTKLFEQSMSSTFSNIPMNVCIILWFVEFDMEIPLWYYFTKFLPPEFPDIHFAWISRVNNVEQNSQYVSRIAKWNNSVLDKLLAILTPLECAYLLKGWSRHALQKKGLIYHFAFGLLAKQDIDDIFAFCEEWHKNKLPVQWTLNFFSHDNK